MSKIETTSKVSLEITSRINLGRQCKRAELSILDTAHKPPSRHSPRHPENKTKKYQSPPAKQPEEDNPPRPPSQNSDTPRGEKPAAAPPPPNQHHITQYTINNHCTPRPHTKPKNQINIPLTTAGPTQEHKAKRLPNLRDILWYHPMINSAHDF